MAFQRSWFEGTIYDMTADPAWWVPDADGKMVKSPLATPFAGKDLRGLLKLTYRRPVARHRGHYGMILQLRGWLPDAIGGRYFVFLDNPAVSPYVVLYAGVTDTHPAYRTYDPEAYSDDSARWAIDFVDNFAGLRFQSMIQDIRAARDPFEKAMFERLPSLEAEALKATDPAARAKVLTDYTVGLQGQVPGMYKKLREALITKYTNNRE